MEAATILTSSDERELGCRITRLGVFPSGREPVDTEHRRFEENFALETTHFIAWQVQIAFEKRESPIEIHLLGRYVTEEGETVGESTALLDIQAGHASYYAYVNWGPEAPGFWKPGRYRLEVYSGTRFIALCRFQVTSAPFVARVSEFGFLDAPADPNRYRPPLRWTFIEEEQPSVRAWLQLGFDARDEAREVPLRLECLRPDGTRIEQRSAVALAPKSSWKVLEFHVDPRADAMLGTHRVAIFIGDKTKATARFEVIERHRALSARPKDLLPIEPELKTPTPRTTEWVNVDLGPAHSLKTFQTATAHQGWIVSVTNLKDGLGDPDYAMVYAYEIEGEVRIGYQLRRYDLMHWDLGNPASYRWFQRNIRRGKPVTVLRLPDGDTCVYGVESPYLLKEGTAAWAAGSLAPT